MAQNSTPLYPFLEKLAHQQHALAKEHFSVKLCQLLHQQTDLLRLFAQNSKSGRILNGEKWIPVSLLNSDNLRRILDGSMKPHIDSAFDELLGMLYKTQMTQDLKDIDSLNQELNTLDQSDESTNRGNLLGMRERVDSGFETQNDAQSVDYQANPPSPSDSILFGWSDDDEEVSRDDCVDWWWTPKKVENKIVNQNSSIQEPKIQTSTLSAVQTNTSVSSSVQNLLPVIPKLPPSVPSPPKSSNNKINVVHIKTVEQAQKLFKAIPALENQFQMTQPLPALDGGALGGIVLVPNGTNGSFTRSNIISLSKSTQNLDSNSTVLQTVSAIEAKVSDSIGSKSSGANGSFGSGRIHVLPNSRIVLPKTNGQQNAPKTKAYPSSVPIGSPPALSPPKKTPSFHTKSIFAIFQCDLCKAVFMDHKKCFKHVGDYHFTESERPIGNPQNHVKILDATSFATSSSSTLPTPSTTVTHANEPSLPETPKPFSKVSPKESSSMQQSLNSIYQRLNLNLKNQLKPNETNYQKVVKKLRASAFPEGDWCPISQEEEQESTETVEVNTGNCTSKTYQQRPLVQMMSDMAKARRNQQNGVMNVALPNADTTRMNSQVKRKFAD